MCEWETGNQNSEQLAVVRPIELANTKATEDAAGRRNRKNEQNESWEQEWSRVSKVKRGERVLESTGLDSWRLFLYFPQRRCLASGGKARIRKRGPMAGFFSE